MSFYKLARKVILGLFVVVAISYGWKLYAYQQQGGLTPPPKPAITKPSSTAATANQTAGYDGSSLRTGERLTYNVAWSEFATAARLELEVVERGIFFGQDSFQI